MTNQLAAAFTPNGLFRAMSREANVMRNACGLVGASGTDQGGQLEFFATREINFTRGLQQCVLP